MCDIYQSYVQDDYDVHVVQIPMTRVPWTSLVVLYDALWLSSHNIRMAVPVEVPLALNWHNCTLGDHPEGIQMRHSKAGAPHQV